MKERLQGMFTAWLLAALLVTTMAGAVGAQDSAPRPGAEDAPVAAAVTVTAEGIAWIPQVKYPYSNIAVIVTDPAGKVQRYEFPAGQTPVLPLVAANGVRLADGAYNYEVQVTPVVGPEAQAAFAAALESRDPAVVMRLQEAGQLPKGPFVQAGTFAVANGAIVAGDAAVEAGEQARAGEATLDQVIPDDLIVQSSLCVGLDCVNNESFGADTIRMKENNTRIKFEDTSVGTFPSNDWQLTANDSANGGANKFSIEDVTGAKVPFTVIAGAPSNSFFMDSSGRIGLRTSTPVLDLHISTGNTPATRLEQTGASGFTAQTWDIAGNEANFFIRDVTNGSQLPFKIQPGADTNSLVIESTNDVGVGTLSPSASLHVRRTDGTAQVLVEETNAVTATRDLASLKNLGPVFLVFNDTTQAAPMSFGSNAGRFTVKFSNVAKLIQNTAGNMTIFGNLTLNGGSCTGCRTGDFATVSQADLLARLADVPIVRWNTLATDPRTVASGADPVDVEVAHISPEMGSFFAAYGYGANSEEIAPLDVATVALASAQALNETIQQQNAILEQQQQLIQAQAAQIAALEARLTQVEAMAHTHTYLPSVQQ